MQQLGSGTFWLLSWKFLWSIFILRFYSISMIKQSTINCHKQSDAKSMELSKQDDQLRQCLDCCLDCCGIVVLIVVLIAQHHYWCLGIVMTQQARLQQHQAIKSRINRARDQKEFLITIPYVLLHIYDVIVW